MSTSMPLVWWCNVWSTFTFIILSSYLLYRICLFTYLYNIRLICLRVLYVACICIYNSSIFSSSWTSTNFTGFSVPLSQVLPLYLVTSFLLDSSSSTVPVPVLVPALGSSWTSRCPAHVAALESHHVAPQGDQPWNHHGHQYNWTKSLPRNKLVEKLLTDVTVTHGGQDFQSNPVWNGDFVCCPFHLFSPGWKIWDDKNKCLDVPKTGGGRLVGGMERLWKPFNIWVLRV